VAAASFPWAINLKYSATLRASECLT
jgi:hypothetical protein